MKYTCPKPAPRVGDLTSPIFHRLALGVGVGNANFSVCVGGNANFSVFRYQHFGIPSAKLWRWGSKLMRGPNANGFASQWNIGFRLLWHSNKLPNMPCFMAHCSISRHLSVCSILVTRDCIHSQKVSQRDKRSALTFKDNVLA